LVIIIIIIILPSGEELLFNYSISTLNFSVIFSQIRIVTMFVTV